MNFDEAIERVLGHEGKYSCDVNDPGGETNFGISKRSYPYVDIAGLTRDGAKAIYKSDFWEHIHADELYDAVAFQSLDFAVNSGIGTAIRYLQRVLGVADDGHWGPVTAAAAKSIPEHRQVMGICAERLDFMRKCKGWPTYSSGWAGRIASNLRYGMQDT